MTLNESIKRLRFTFSKGNKPNQTDVEAFNTMLQWIGREKEEKVNSNRLFAKLYLERLAKEIVFLKGDYQSSMQRIESHLRMPLEMYYKRFSEEMKLNQLTVFSEMLGIQDKPISWMNTEKRAKAKELLKDNHQEFLSVINSDFWSLDKTIPRLNDLITDVINSNENLP